MRKMYPRLLVLLLLLLSLRTMAQVTLSGTSYTETFDNIGSGLPTGWTVRTSASSTALGTTQAFTPAATLWSSSTGAFRNFASADGLTKSSSVTAQSASTDRALGVRQTGNFGDPGAAFVLQLTNTTGFSGFILNFKLQSLDTGGTRTVQWAVDYGVGSAPASFNTVTTSPTTLPTGASNFSNTGVTVNFGSALDNQSQNVWIRIIPTGVSTGTGNRPSTGIDDFTLNYSQSGVDATPPSVSTLSPANNSTNVVSTLSTASITFDEPIQKGSGSIVLKKVSDNSVVQTIDVASASVSVSNNTASFPVSLAQNTAYYVQIPNGAFKDIAGNNFAGISSTTAWTFATGTLIYSANFNICSSSLTEGFTQYSVVGAETWGCTSFGRDPNNPPAGSAANGVQINGFANGTNVPDEDWLISPSFNLTGTTYPLLTFWSRTAFNGAPLQLKVSTNYSGSGDPRLATWTDLNGRFPGLASDVWTASSQINLSAFKQPSVYVAFVYVSTNEEGARWTLDDISIDNSSTPPSPTLTVSTTDVQFGFVSTGSSAVKTFTAIGNDITSSITVSSTSNFQVSSDGTNFSSSATFPQASSNNVPQTVYVRFTPTQEGQNYSGTATVTTSGQTATVNLTGTSIDAAKTLDIVNWNIEWFGSTVNGPANDSLQEQNVKKVVQAAGADLYALVEVVDTARLGNIVRSMPGYTYIVSNYGSHTNSTVSGDGPLSEAQKLGFVYKTSMFSNVSVTPLLNLTTNSAEDAASVNYQNWSSGRYPFMMNANVTLNGVTKNIKFIAIHAKANTSPTITSYNRRRDGADSLRALLSRTYPNDNIIIVGDFNDDLDSTITSGINPRITSYASFVNDSVNYPAITLALSRAGKKSTVSYNDMIDQVVVSNEMRAYYMEGSVQVLTDVASTIPNYSSTTSDHYPVYSRYAFDPAILPIKLLQFSVVKKADNVVLNWKTAQEFNSKEFVVQRSKDGVTFEAIGKVAANGYSNIEKGYSFTDLHPGDGTNYYRLVQVDKDDKAELSKVLKVQFGSYISVVVSPNPAKNEARVFVNGATENLTLQLIDLSGKVVKQQKSSAAVSQTTLLLNDLSKGVYLLKVQSDKEIVTRKLVID